MTGSHLHKFVLCLSLALALVLTGAGVGLADNDTKTPAGTVISNHAEAVYYDEAGTGYATMSPTVTITVLPVAALTVTPDETEPSDGVGPRERITRLFRICNTGNTPDLYTITRADSTAPATLVALYYDVDASGTLTQGDTQITLNATLSPRVNPGACLGILAVVDTNDVPAHSRLNLELTARSNVTGGANGLAEDTGTIINSVGQGADFSSPLSPSLPPLKLVENQERITTTPGQVLNYVISFRNYGDVPARAVVVADDLPAGLSYVAGTLRLGTRALTDQDDTDEGRVLSLQRFEVRLALVAPDEVVRISFQARVTGQIAAGTGAVNQATIAAANAQPRATNDAVAIVDPFGIVYAGRSGGGVTINGAQVTLRAERDSDAPFGTLPDIGFTPNTHNTNPFATVAGGRFNFVLTPAQLGVAGAGVRYFLHVRAQGYRSRLLELSVRPGLANLYDTTVRALDGQPVARAGSFDLTDDAVELGSLAALVLNVPLFENAPLEISKSADQQRAEIGDVVTYRVEVHNPTSGAINDVIVRDTLPTSFHYAPGTALFDNGTGTTRTINPEVQGNTLTFPVGTLAGGARGIITYRVRIGANAREGENLNSAFVEGRDLLGERIVSQPARAAVRVGRGIFSTQQIVLGRVFADTNGNAQFDPGERGLAGVRLYMPNGQSVTTDANGMYNLPAVNDGSVVVALDPVTLPAGYKLTDSDTRDGQSWTRLLRTPLGGGGLLRQNFALQAPADSADQSASSDTATTATAAAAPQTQQANFTPVVANSGPANTSAPALGPADRPTPAAPLAPGTYEVKADEAAEPVAAGTVRIDAPASEEVIRTSALALAISVAEDWTVQVEVERTRISAANIGEQRVDHQHKTTTFNFFGINLKPGPNRVRVTPISPEGNAGLPVEQTVYGRGPAVRLEVLADRKELQADGRDQTRVRVRAFDRWGHPAADMPIALEVSSGSLLRPETAAPTPTETRPHEQSTLDADATTQYASGLQRQLVVSTVGGEAVLLLVADSAAGTADLRATSGTLEARGAVRYTPELRAAMLVGLAEVSVGRAAPDNALRGTDSQVRSHVEFFYRGRVFGQNLVTLAYDSQRALNRLGGRDRLFQLDPLSRTYPLFGDTSTRAEDAQSNSKLFARVDRNRSYAMFGDFDTEQSALGLAGYGRRLTGVKVHAENARGDFLAVTGARPDTAFTRDVFAAGRLGLIQLSHNDILTGSETVTLEVRDRRNPELILSREVLIRSVDYNLDTTTGELFMLRPISAFDYALNLVQLVVTYEHLATGLSSAVYTARGVQHIGRTGTQLGFSFVDQQQSDLGTFMLGGLDGEQKLPHGGRLQFEWAVSRGRVTTTGNLFSTANEAHNGNAYRLELTQPLPFRDTTLRAAYARADEGFLNPFGTTVTPGSQRATVSADIKLRRTSLLRLGLADERNRTANVNNERQTASLLWTETFTDRIRATVGYDFRNFTDTLNDRRTASNLVSLGVEWQATDKLQVAVKREQNLSAADPTYPNQTTLAASYQVNPQARLFFTQRLAAAPIVPISDAGATGFVGTGSRTETAVGIETRVGRNTALSGRYQLENGVNGTDSFAVIGLQNRLPLNERLALDFSFERGFHMAGAGASFTGGSFGVSYLAHKDLRTAARYEVRSQNGSFGQLATVGAAGRLGHGVTTLARFQWAQSSYQGRDTASLSGTAALAVRPVERDDRGLLFSYTHRSYTLNGTTTQAATTDRSDVLSSDGYYQLDRRTELFGRLALKFGGNSREGLINTSALTYLAQLRAQRRIRRAFDTAVEYRLLAQPVTHTRRSAVGAEVGYWFLRDVRFAIGYNFTAAVEPNGGPLVGPPRGFYFTISTKFSNLFDLFGTAADGLAPHDATAQPLPAQPLPSATTGTSQPNSGGSPQ